MMFAAPEASYRTGGEDETSPSAMAVVAIRHEIERRVLRFMGKEFRGPKKLP